MVTCQQREHPLCPKALDLTDLGPSPALVQAKERIFHSCQALGQDTLISGTFPHPRLQPLPDSYFLRFSH